MTEKERYEELEVEVLHFENVDVIITSQGVETGKH